MVPRHVGTAQPGCRPGRRAGAPGEPRLKWPNDLVTGRGKGGRHPPGGVRRRGCCRDRSQPLLARPAAGSAALLSEDPGPDLAEEIGVAWSVELLRRVECGPERWGRAEYVAACTTLGREITWEPDGRGRASTSPRTERSSSRPRAESFASSQPRSATSGRQTGSSSGRRPPSSHYCPRPWPCLPSRAVSPSCTGPIRSRWGPASSRATWPGRTMPDLPGGAAPPRHQRDHRDREGPGGRLARKGYVTLAVDLYRQRRRPPISTRLSTLTHPQATRRR